MSPHKSGTSLADRQRDDTQQAAGSHSDRPLPQASRGNLPKIPRYDDRGNLDHQCQVSKAILHSDVSPRGNLGHKAPSGNLGL